MKQSAAEQVVAKKGLAITLWDMLDGADTEAQADALLDVLASFIFQSVSTSRRARGHPSLSRVPFSGAFDGAGGCRCQLHFQICQLLRILADEERRIAQFRQGSVEDSDSDAPDSDAAA
jgi:hypothetical protein